MLRGGISRVRAQIIIAEEVSLAKLRFMNAASYGFCLFNQRQMAEFPKMIDLRAISGYHAFCKP